MNTVLSLGYRFVKTAVMAASLLAVANPAFALEINNNANATLNVSIKECANPPISTKVAPDQTYGCVTGEQCSGTCSYSIESSGSNSCNGKIDAGSGLQVNPGLNCKPY
ncbi:MAG: hypothetical protein M0R41_09300 [Methylobacter tundripaludum]|uniref:Uncharacterized protein n=1 Tax=Methylobacter tundripaludum TaxID=173365 RepID=A0A2S6H4W3_9GAMM|nr:hypothetical protein [Methylobacter tundripaludum]MCK9636460.1 hypothetical protein [Methylobacter tundripaludum]PPK72460.1 hypothetical protein B0F88_104255 [Methylobacter tundripaludum]